MFLSYDHSQDEKERRHKHDGNDGNKLCGLEVDVVQIIEGNGGILS
jgi:hypothetical protein